MIKFSKLHGAGNDFILVDNRNNCVSDKREWVMKACNRHFGVGADGVMFVEDSKDCDVKMDFWNSDGTHSTMCGNGIRCFAKFVYDNDIVNKESFEVETRDGIKIVRVVDSSEIESTISVDLGNWAFSSPAIDKSLSEIMNKKIQAQDREFEISCVYMGVPHGIIYVDKIDEDVTCRYGSIIEKNPLFPEGMNVNFVKIVDKNHIEVDTWERGAGKTLACGTGSCAAVIISHRLGKLDGDVKVDVPGGQLKISLSENKVIMEGKATNICKGELH